MLPRRLTIPDGLFELRNDLPAVVDLIVRTAWWVHPDTFKALPVWYPETARGKLIYDATWNRIYENKNRETAVVSERRESNTKAGKALVSALGTSNALNWTVCHIWGVDDPKFGKSNRVVRDPRFYTCVGNMVWLPTPLKGFTDSMPEVKRILRTCAFRLYDWACEHPDVEKDANAVRKNEDPPYYPASWPTRTRPGLPERTAPFSEAVRQAVAKRKATIKRMLNDDKLIRYPGAEVREVLAFWKVEL